MQQTTENTSTSAPITTTTEEFIIKLTDKAIEMIKEARDSDEDSKGKDLRIAVVGGGCSGYQYALNFDNEISDDDVVIEQSDIKVVVDHFSASHLQGTVLDYVDSLNGSGFKFNNPKAKRTCGCGSSFSG